MAPQSPNRCCGLVSLLIRVAVLQLGTERVPREPHMRTAGVRGPLQATLINRCCGLVSLLNPTAERRRALKGQERQQQTLSLFLNRCCGLVSLLIQLREQVAVLRSRPHMEGPSTVVWKA